ncbi:MAG: ABC transporter permease [Lachnospiraceae bacterium]|nr:ABC transporter permease [Lachnospiraceae bacterium]
MKMGFYLKMAWSGIYKNKRLYTPYILTCMGMVMMYYIVAFLCASEVLSAMPGGDVVQQMMRLGRGVIGVFAVIFLFYTNSFLVRRRKKEFGLYNILGMGKWNLARVLLRENLITAVLALAGGLTAGIVFSKFAELGAVNLLLGEISFSLKLDMEAVWGTVKLFAGIFLLILINGLRQIRLASPIELLRSENVGERPPKANWFVAAAGAALLGTAYYMAVSIDNPVDALVWFFVAVIMVIVATYLLFIAGSVVICRILQKNKSYYYKTGHFVSVSSMTYRMKRNGAGLASICILSTMVLVMLSGTVCLYVGAEDSMRTRYPRNINLTVAMQDPGEFDSDSTEAVRQLAGGILQANGQEPEMVLDYRTAYLGSVIRDGRIATYDSAAYSFQTDSYADTWEIFIVPLEDYNRLTGENETLEPDEVLVCATKYRYEEETVAFGDETPRRVKRTVEKFVDNGVDAMQIIPSLYVVVPDFDACVRPMMQIADARGNRLVNFTWFYGFDLEAETEVQIDIQRQIMEKLHSLSLEQNQLSAVSCEGAAAERAGFYGIYGGLFFLGILLGIVFLFAAVLIMYYKQISEGYEDQARFEIMRKVGMTGKEIRQSINSQILTVFFLPLLTAGLHLAFAFPLMHKLLVLFSLTNLRLLITVTVCCYLVFALFYMLMQRITSKAYYAIVRGA